MNITDRHFNGFSPKSLQFLKNVKAKNDKAWFEKNRGVYEQTLLEPFRNLVGDLGPTMLEIDPKFEITPAVNKTLSRISRDTRFSRDKSLYRDTMWFAFKTRRENWQQYPGFFFELSPDSFRYGMGYYSASPATMKSMREHIDDDPKAFARLLEVFSKQNRYVVEGETYKRVFDNTKPQDIQNFYQRKNLYFVSNNDIDDMLFSEKLANRLITDFISLKPFYSFLSALE